jgi:hypothetical protein
MLRRPPPPPTSISAPPVSTSSLPPSSTTTTNNQHHEHETRGNHNNNKEEDIINVQWNNNSESTTTTTPGYDHNNQQHQDDNNNNYNNWSHGSNTNTNREEINNNYSSFPSIPIPSLEQQGKELQLQAQQWMMMQQQQQQQQQQPIQQDTTSYIDNNSHHWNGNNNNNHQPRTAITTTTNETDEFGLSSTPPPINNNIPESINISQPTNNIPPPITQPCGGQRFGRAICLGFGGLLSVCSPSSITLHKINTLSTTTTTTSQPLIDIFEPLLGLSHPLSNQELEVLAQNIESRSYETIQHDDDDITTENNDDIITSGDLPGSSKFLWKALSALIRCHGKRSSSHYHKTTTSFKPISLTTKTITDILPWERRIVDLLSSNPFDDNDDHHQNRTMMMPRHNHHSTSPTTTSTSTTTTTNNNKINPTEALAELEMLLLNGDQEAAVLHAMQYELWTHALIISNFLSAASYRRVVHEFLSRTSQPGLPLYTILNLLAGRGIDALPTLTTTTTDQPAAATITIKTTWRQTLRAMLTNRTPNDGIVFRTFGDRLWQETKSVAAAHLCYLLGGHFPMESPLEREDGRILLVGSDHISPTVLPNQFVHPVAILRTEIVLYALSVLASSSSSSSLEFSTKESSIYQAVYSFQPFRLVYAMWLADLGEVNLAKKWVESIFNIVQQQTNSSSNDAFFIQLELFQHRLNGTLPSNVFLVPSNRSEQQQQSSSTSSSSEWIGNKLDFNTVVDLNNNNEVGHYSEPINQENNIIIKVEVEQTDNEQQSEDDDNADPFMAAAATTATTTTNTINADPFAVSSSFSRNISNPSNNSSRNVQFGKRAISEPIKPTATTTITTVPSFNHSEEHKNEISTQPTPPPTQPSTSIKSSNPVQNQQQQQPPRNSSSFSISEKISDTRNWLIHQIVGIPPNAKIANTGGKLEAYYDEKLGRWIFPGDDVNAVTPSVGPPPVKPVSIATTTTSATGSGSDDKVNHDNNTVTNKPPPMLSSSNSTNKLGTAGGGGGGGSMRNRYVVMT